MLRMQLEWNAPTTRGLIDGCLGASISPEDIAPAFSICVENIFDCSSGLSPANSTIVSEQTK
jgi:hypothetical protein